MRRVDEYIFADENNSTNWQLCSDHLKNGWESRSLPFEVTAKINQSRIAWRNGVPGKT